MLYMTRESPFAGALLDLGVRRQDIVVLSADLSKYTDVAPFADQFPDRFFQIGMAEQNMMGIAAGLAKTGMLPIAVTYGVFATRRAYEQVAMAMTTGPSRAIIVAFLPGITTSFRATHQAIDDLALMRALPAMCVIDPADATEFAAAIPAAVAHTGTVYMRGQRGAVRQIFDPSGFRFTIGKTREMHSGSGVGIISTGLGTQWVMEASGLLERSGVAHSLLHVPTLKPFDSQAVTEFSRRHAAVVTVENHSIVGGLASAVAEAMAASGAGTRLKALGVPDCWAPAGSIDHIRREIGLDAGAIAHIVASLS